MLLKLILLQQYTFEQCHKQLKKRGRNCCAPCSPLKQKSRPKMYVNSQVISKAATYVRTLRRRRNRVCSPRSRIVQNSRVFSLFLPVRAREEEGLFSPSSTAAASFSRVILSHKEDIWRVNRRDDPPVHPLLTAALCSFVAKEMFVRNCPHDFVGKKHANLGRVDGFRPAKWI